MNDFFAYPRTPHLEDSAVQVGDEPNNTASFSGLKQIGATAVYEEKVDGANCGFRFDSAGELHAQSRGHYLDVNDRSVFTDRPFNLFKEWLAYHREEFLQRFEDRYIIFGEWMGVTHSIFYDALPHLFLEFDIWDCQARSFLDTPARHALCAGLPIVHVPVLYRGPARDIGHLKSFIGPSAYRTDDWRVSLRQACGLLGDDYRKRLVKMDESDQIEGVYVKLEQDGTTIGRYKWVRPGFAQTILDANEHWQSRFPVPNLLAAPTDMFPAYIVKRNNSPARSGLG